MASAQLGVADRETIWDRFVQRWPLETLASLTLREYNQAGADDHFCRWVEKHTEALGSIWGGSSLKFGIYSRSSTATKEPSAQRGVMQDANYGWYNKYGATAEEAFAVVRRLIAQTAQAARAGRLEEVENIDLWPIFRRKIAFLYQDREHPCILPIYIEPMLRRVWGDDAPKDTVALYKGFMSRREGKPLLSYADEVYARVEQAQSRASQEGAEETLAHFASANGLLEALESQGTTSAFIELARGLHERGLDWWITKAELIHAGRTEDPEIWQAAVALRLKVSNGIVLVQSSDLESDEDDAPVLNADGVHAWVEQAGGSPRIQAVTHRRPCWPDEYGRGEERLSVGLSESNIRNGQVKVSRLQRLFPATNFCPTGERPTETFSLALPSGERIEEAWVLSDRHRLQPKLEALMAGQQLRPGDYAVISKLAPRHYQLSFDRQGQFNASSPKPTIDLSATFMKSQKPVQPLNQILYGPPGTGKTYSTIEAALAILDPDFLDQNRIVRVALKARFDGLVKERRIRVVTFHQSFSYEDFVEGLRATTTEDSGQIRYEVVDGVFKSLCVAAAAKVSRPTLTASDQVQPFDVRGRRIWKMSLGNTLGSDAGIYDECIENGYALLGYGSGVDFTGCTSREEVLKQFEASGLKIENPQTDYAVTSVTAFVTRMKPGDLLVISDGNFKFRAVGEVAGGYQHQPHNEFPDAYSQKRNVKWLRTYEPSLPHGELMNNQFSQMTLYELRPGSSIDLEKLKRLLNDGGAAPPNGELQLGPVGVSGYAITRVTSDLVELTKPNGNNLPFATKMLTTLAEGVRAGLISFEDIRSKQAIDKLPNKGLEPYLVNGYNNILAPLVEQMCSVASAAPTSNETVRDEARVLIIDEINRGNISRIFGELITLIEPSKRTGADEQLEVVLPYSKSCFGVPKNVYLIGTMNTADRSLTGLDVALRRRFIFKEMPPRHEMLEGVNVDGIRADLLLDVLNQRIEALLDRDHCLGHAYFMPLRETPTLGKLGEIFRNQVLPLLQEYFFEDWQRIQWVLNDHRKPARFQFVSPRGVDVGELFGAAVNVARNPQIWTVNEEAFKREESYLGVIDHRDATDDE